MYSRAGACAYVPGRTNICMCTKVKRISPITLSEVSFRPCARLGGEKLWITSYPFRSPHPLPDSSPSPFQITIIFIHHLHPPSPHLQLHPQLSQAVTMITAIATTTPPKAPLPSSSFPDFPTITTNPRRRRPLTRPLTIAFDLFPVSARPL